MFPSGEFEPLTNEQLNERLRELQHGESAATGELDRLQRSLEELQVHRMELEMQNRTLRELQAELEQSVQRYADLYENLPLPYVTLTPEGQITGANRAALECMHTDKPSLLGLPIGRFVDAYDGGRLAAHLEECVQSGRPGTIELTLRLTDGRTATVQMASRVVPLPQKAPAQVHVAITDVTKLKQVQRTLEDINREQEALNYSLSHDLRGPLVTISNYARIVLSEHGAGLNEEARGMIQRVEAAAGRMQHTLKQLLEYSTVAREDVVLGPVDLDELVRGVVAEQRVAIQERNAEVIVERPLACVLAAAGLMSHVVSKLLANALMYTKSGATPRVRIFCEQNDSVVVLNIADEGIGIEPRNHEKIFGVFERLHGYSQYPGSGVGLAIARRATERMKGRIWVKSQVGQGSCFCVELPKAKTPRGGSPQP